MCKRLLKTLVAVAMLYGLPVMAIEEAKYSVVIQDGDFELRDYQPHLLAEVVVDGSFEEAGSNAFRYLFKYISGENRPELEITMTAPVSQQVVGEEISMTAPVSQYADKGRYVVSFMMPASYSLETLPRPRDDKVAIRQVAAQRMAVVTYSGTWSQANYEESKQALEAWMAANDLKVVGEAVWARYNAPFSLWFLRRNEIQFPVAVKSAPTEPE